MKLFSFYDREAVEFIQHLLDDIPDEKPNAEKASAKITNPLGLSIETQVNDLESLLQTILKMLKVAAQTEDRSVISHQSYIKLVHSLLSRVESGDQFWELVSLITRILLIYKFSECSEYLLESFNALSDVSALFVVSRVFFDQVATLVERHQILKNLNLQDKGQNQVAVWGLLATISLSA